MPVNAEAWTDLPSAFSLSNPYRKDAARRLHKRGFAVWRFVLSVRAIHGYNPWGQFAVRSQSVLVNSTLATLVETREQGTHATNKTFRCLMTNDHSFVTHWRVVGTAEEIYDVISRPLDFPRWLAV
jgi:hypothetical protein